MNRIMFEMWEEMMPLMMPEGRNMDSAMRERMAGHMRMKLKHGLQEGEIPGSLHEAMKAMMPDMKMSPEIMKPGGEDKRMVQAMLQGWQRKHGSMPDVEPISMATEPTPPIKAASTAR